MSSNAKNSTNSSHFGPSADLCVSPYVFPTFTAWFVVYLLCFPIYLSALYVLYKKWKKPIQLSDSDVFTLYIIIMEMVKIVGLSCLYYSICNMIGNTLILRSIILVILPRYGQIFLNCLACVERYLAVVHPITYLRLKKRGGIIMRNTCIGLAGLLSSGLSALAHKQNLIFFNQIFSLLVSLSSLVLLSFCTIAVLRVLIQPGPGEGGGDRKKINQPKRLALKNMSFILGAQFLDIVNFSTFYLVGVTGQVKVDVCLLFTSSLWLGMPNSLVLPLLLLHRTKKE